MMKLLHHLMVMNVLELGKCWQLSTTISAVFLVCFLKANVLPSVSVTEHYVAWVCLDKSEGSVYSSHCTCMTG